MEVKPYLFLNFPLHSFKPLKGMRIDWDEANESMVITNKAKVSIIPVNSISGRTIKFSCQLRRKKELLLPLIVKLNKFNPKISLIKMTRINLIIRREEGESIFFEHKQAQNIVDFFWLNEHHYILVTSNSVELYSFRKQVKVLKVYPVKEQILFAVYNSTFNVLMIALHLNSNHLNSFLPFRIAPNGKALNKLGKIVFKKKIKELTRMNVQIFRIYNFCIFIVVDINAQRAILFRYVQTENSFIQEREYNLYSSGKYTINIVDNILVFHNSFNKYSLIFDLLCFEDTPIAPPMSIAQYKKFSKESNVNEPDKLELYSPLWKFYSPNLVLDQQLGFLFELQMNLLSIPLTIKSKTGKIEFLFRRKNSKFLLKNILREMILEINSEVEIAHTFKIINHFYLTFLNSQKKVSDVANVPEKKKIDPSAKDYLQQQGTTIVRTMNMPILDQGDMLTLIFKPLEEHKAMTPKKMFVIILEYISSLISYKIPIKIPTQLFLVKVLLNQKAFLLLNEYFEYELLKPHPKIASMIFPFIFGEGRELIETDETSILFDIILKIYKYSRQYRKIIELYIIKNDPLRVMGVVERYDMDMTKCLNLSLFFEMMKKKNDPVLFYNIYKRIKVNLKKKKKDLPTDCMEYRDLYYDMFVGQIRNSLI